MRLDFNSWCHLAPALALTGLMVGLGGCPGTLSDPAEFSVASTSDGPGSDADAPGDAGTASCRDVPTTLLETTCGVVGCHNPSSPAEGLDLASPGVVSRLLDVPGTEAPALGLLLINSMNPAQSIILTKLRASTVPYGAQMPLGGTPLSDSEIACVAAWISSVVATADAGPDSASD